MTIAALALLALAVGVMVAVHVRTQKRLEQRITRVVAGLEAADEARQFALYKQHKVLTKRIAAAERATAKMVDETRATSATLKEDARLLHERADTLVREMRHG